MVKHILEAEWQRDDALAFSFYEEEKRIAVLTIAKIETLLKEADNDLKLKKQLEKSHATTKRELEEVTKRYEDDKRKAIAEKESFNAELKFLKYAKLNDAEAVKFFNVGQADEEETSDEDKAAIGKAETTARRKSGSKGAAGSDGQLKKTD